MLQNNPKLKALIVSLWNTFWSGGIANPITAIEQITYLLLLFLGNSVTNQETIPLLECGNPHGNISIEIFAH